MNIVLGGRTGQYDMEWRGLKKVKKNSVTYFMDSP